MHEQSAQWYDAIYAFKDYTGEAERLHGGIREHKRSPELAIDCSQRLGATW
jgi:hypothetical protein